MCLMYPHAQVGSPDHTVCLFSLVFKPLFFKKKHSSVIVNSRRFLVKWVCNWSWTLVSTMSNQTVEAKVRVPQQTCVNLTHESAKCPTSAIEEINRKCWADYAGRSTCAAVTHLGDKSNPVPVKIIWRITLVFGIVLTVVSTYFSTLSFMNMAGNSEMILKRIQSIGLMDSSILNITSAPPTHSISQSYRVILMILIRAL